MFVVFFHPTRHVVLPALPVPVPMIGVGVLGSQPNSPMSIVAPLATVWHITSVLCGLFWLPGAVEP